MTSLAHQSARSWNDWGLRDGNYRYCFRRMSMERKHFRPWSSDETVTYKKPERSHVIKKKKVYVWTASLREMSGGLPMLFNCLITELTQVPTQPNLSLWFTTVLIEKILPIENLWKVNVFLSICWIE